MDTSLCCYGGDRKNAREEFSGCAKHRACRGARRFRIRRQCRRGRARQGRRTEIDQCRRALCRDRQGLFHQRRARIGDRAVRIRAADRSRGRRIDFGPTAPPAGLFQLAGSGAIRIISGFYDEAPGFHNFAVAASIKAYDGGLKNYKDLPNHSVAVTQVGSPVHYSLALIAEKYHLDLNQIRVLPLQSIPNMASAIRGNTADATVINSTSVNPLLASNSAKLLGWVGDETPWQTAVTFTQPKTIEQHKATVEAFLRALKEGARYYHDAYTGSDEKPKDGPTAAEVTGILAKYTGLTDEQVKASLAH